MSNTSSWIERAGMAGLTVMPMLALVAAPCLLLIRDDLYERILSGCLLALALWQTPPAWSAMIDAVNPRRMPHQLILFHDFLNRLAWHDGTQRRIVMENAMRLGLVPALGGMVCAAAVLGTGAGWSVPLTLTVCLVTALVCLQQWCADRADRRVMMGVCAFMPIVPAIILPDPLAHFAWGGMFSLVVGGGLCVYTARVLRDVIRRSPVLKHAAWVLGMLGAGLAGSCLVTAVQPDGVAAIMWALWFLGLASALAHERRERAGIKVWLLSLS